MSMMQEKMYMDVDDVCAILGVSKTYAYKYIQMTKKMIELLINGYEYNENERKSKDDENN